MSDNILNKAREISKLSNEITSKVNTLNKLISNLTTSEAPPHIFDPLSKASSKLRSGEEQLRYASSLFLDLTEEDTAEAEKLRLKYVEEVKSSLDKYNSGLEDLIKRKNKEVTVEQLKYKRRAERS